MFGSDMVGVAIGMVLLYLILSLVCSAANELVEAVLKKRAADLAKGLRTLLNDPQGNGIVKALYNHPLIYGLFSKDYDPAKPRNLPSYIP